MLIDRIELNIEGNSERTEITLTWAGGFTSRHQHNRTVRSYSQLSNLKEFITRVVELKETGMTLVQVAKQINQEGYLSLQRRPFTTMMLCRLLLKQGINTPRGSTIPDSQILQEHEWCLKNLAMHIGMPPTTLSHWREIGWVNGRKLPGGRGRWLLWADESEVERLIQLRAARRRWSDCPYPVELTTPASNQPNAS